MTLALTAAQQETLRALARKGQEALYLARFDFGVVLRFRLVGAQTGGRTLNLFWSIGVTPSSTFVEIPAAAATSDELFEAARQAASDFVLDTFAPSPVKAWSQGNAIYVRLPPGAVSTLISGTAIDEGEMLSDGQIVPEQLLMVSGGQDVDDGLELAQAGVLKVGSNAIEKDGLTSAVTHRQRELTLDWIPDGELENILIQVPIVGATVALSRGVRGRAFSSWVPAGTNAVVDGPLPAHAGNETAAFNPGVVDRRPPIRLVLKDRIVAALEAYAPNAAAFEGLEIFPGHPLEVALRLIRASIQDLEGTNEEIIDVPSFDPSVDVPIPVVDQFDVSFNAGDPALKRLIASTGNSPFEWEWLAFPLRQAGQQLIGDSPTGANFSSHHQAVTELATPIDITVTWQEDAQHQEFGIGLNPTFPTQTFYLPDNDCGFTARSDLNAFGGNCHNISGGAPGVYPSDPIGNQSWTGVLPWRITMDSSGNLAIYQDGVLIHTDVREARNRWYVTFGMVSGGGGGIIDIVSGLDLSERSGTILRIDALQSGAISGVFSSIRGVSNGPLTPPFTVSWRINDRDVPNRQNWLAGLNPTKIDPSGDSPLDAYLNLELSVAAFHATWFGDLQGLHPIMTITTPFVNSTSYNRPPVSDNWVSQIDLFEMSIDGAGNYQFRRNGAVLVTRTVTPGQQWYWHCAFSSGASQNDSEFESEFYAIEGLVETVVDPTVPGLGHLVVGANSGINFSAHSALTIIGGEQIRRTNRPFATGFSREPPEATKQSPFEQGNLTAQDALNELLLIMPWQVTPDEDGKIRARRIDVASIQAGTATIRDWSGIFIPDGPPSELAQDLLNALISKVGEDWESEDREFWRQAVAFEDRLSQAAHAQATFRRLIRTWRVRSLFLSQVSCIYGGEPDERGHGIFESLRANSTSFGIYWPFRNSFSGSRVDAITAPSTTTFVPVDDFEEPPPWARLNPAQNAILRIQSGADAFAYDGAPGNGLGHAASGFELIRCDSARIDPSPLLAVRAYRLADRERTADGTLVPWGAPMRYGIAERGYQGTFPRTFNGALDPDWEWLAGCPIADVTILQFLAAKVFNSHAWGFPSFEGHTDLQQLDVQVGDFVTVPIPHMIGFGGVTGVGMVFQVLAKRELAGRIKWRIGLASRVDTFLIQRVISPEAGPTAPGQPQLPIFQWVPRARSVTADVNATITDRAAAASITISATATPTVIDPVVDADATASISVSGSATPTVVP